MTTIRSITMAQKQLTRKEWDQANDLSDELMTVMVGKGTSVGVSVIAAAFLIAKALLTLSDNNNQSSPSPPADLSLFLTLLKHFASQSAPARQLAPLTRLGSFAGGPLGL